MRMIEGFPLVATAPDGIARLRELILSLAVMGKLVQQDPNDEPADALLKKIRTEKDRLIAEGKIKRDKPLSDIGDEEKRFSLPPGWKWVRLNHLVSKLGAGSTPLGGKDVYVDQGIKFLRSQNVWNDGLRLDAVAFITPETHAGMAGTVVAPNDILFNITGASIGRCAVVPSEFDEANVSQHVAIVRPLISDITPYLHLVLTSPYVQQTVMDVQVGVSREGLSMNKLGQFGIPVPPLPEQFRIVAKVDELMCLCNELDVRDRLEAEQHARLTATLFDSLAASESSHALAENWSRIAEHFDLLLDRPEAVGALERTILQLAVRGQLVPQDPNDEPVSKIVEQLRADSSSDPAVKIPRAGGTPTDAEGEAFAAPLGWAWAPFHLVVECLNGYAFKSEWFRAQGVRLVRNTNISHGYVDWDQVACVDADTAAEFERFALEAGDIVLSLDRPIISSGLKYAEIKTADLPCLLLQRVAKLTPRAKSITRSFLKMWLTSPYFTDLLDPGRSNGVPHISTKQIGTIRFALPPVAEQHRIVARVQGLLRLCADLRARVTARQTCQARFAEALVGQAASTAPLVAHTADLAAAA